MSWILGFICGLAAMYGMFWLAAHYGKKRSDADFDYIKQRDEEMLNVAKLQYAALVERNQIGRRHSELLATIAEREVPR